MEQNEACNGQNQGFEKPFSSNVKSSQKYSRFGEIIRYMTLEELRKFTDSIDNRTHRLMFEMIYELGCRVGEFVRIRLKHIDFNRSMIYFPAENTKTRQPRWSYLPQRVASEIKAYLKDRGSMNKRDDSIRDEEEFLFHVGKSGAFPYTENRIRQIFRKYARRAGLDRDYGRDSCGRKLHQFTVHSLRHSHLMHYIHHYKLPLPVVQKQVGHRTLKATSVYLRPSEQLVIDAYRQAEEFQNLRRSPIGLNTPETLPFYNDTGTLHPQRKH
jgi:integrase